MCTYAELIVDIAADVDVGTVAAAHGNESSTADGNVGIDIGEVNIQKALYFKTEGRSGL